MELGIIFKLSMERGESERFGNRLRLQTNLQSTDNQRIILLTNTLFPILGGESKEYSGQGFKEMSDTWKAGACLIN